MKKQARQAVTLLEIIIAIGIFSIIGVITVIILQRSLVTNRYTADRNLAAQQATTAMEWLRRDINSAYGVLSAEETSNITLVSPDSNSIKYYLDANAKTLYRKVCADSSHIVTEDVSQFSLKYYNLTNQIVADPANNNPSLKTIEIDLTTQKNNQQFKLNTVARFKYNPDYEWIKTYRTNSDNEHLRVVKQVSDGYILGGYRTPEAGGDSDFLVIKTDATGHVAWAKTYNGGGDEKLRALQPISDGNGGYILGGYTDSFSGNYDFFVVKIDANGNKIWAKNYGNNTIPEWLLTLEPTPTDDGYILGGYAFTGGGKHMLVIKLTSTGVLDSSFGTNGAEIYKGTCNEFLYAIHQLIDGSYILAGDTCSFGAAVGSDDFFLAKISADGKTCQWGKTYGGSANDSFDGTSDGSTEPSHTLIPTSDGYILGGNTWSFGVGSVDFLVIKTDASGNVGAAGTWAKTYGKGVEDWLRTLEPTFDGGYLMGGKISDNRSIVVKITVTGDLDTTFGSTGAKKFLGAGENEFFSLQQTSDDGGYIIGGDTGSEIDFLLVKTDSSGGVSCCNDFTDQDITITTPSLQFSNFIFTLEAPSVTESDVFASVSVSDVTSSTTIGSLCPQE